MQDKRDIWLNIMGPKHTSYFFQIKLEDNVFGYLLISGLLLERKMDRTSECLLSNDSHGCPFISVFCRAEYLNQTNV